MIRRRSKQALPEQIIRIEKKQKMLTVHLYLLSTKSLSVDEDTLWAYLTVSLLVPLSRYSSCLSENKDIFRK